MPPARSRPPHRRLLAALPLAIGLGCATAPSTAAAWELRGGIVRQDAVSLWAIGRNHERAWALNAEIGFTPWGRVLAGEVAPMVGGTLAAGNALDSAYAGMTWTWRGPEPLFLRLGLGGAIHNGKSNDPPTYGSRRQMGSRFLFHVPVEVGMELTRRTAVSLYFTHMSNGELGTPNPGLDSLGLRFSVLF